MAILPTEKTWGVKKRDIKYLNRDFTSLRQSLIDFTKTYYSNTYSDFNSTSPGMMFIEQAAYVGDILSYYTDAQLKESFINLAGNYKNIITQSQNMGYKPKLSRPATTTLTVYQTVPNIGTGENNKPDYTYALKIKEGMRISSTLNNAIEFITTDDVDFKDSTNRSVSVFQTNSVSGEATLYLLSKKVTAISATIKTQTYTVSEFEQNLVVPINDDNFIGIQRVEDDDNNVYYEVPYMAQEMVYIKVPNVESNDPQLSQYRESVPYLLKLLRTPRRFTTKIIDSTNVELRFGSGTGDTSDELLIPSTKNVGLGMNNSIDKLGETFDPTNFLKTSTYGIAPAAGRTLTISYLSGGGIGSNVQTNDLRTITNIEFDEDLLQYTTISQPLYDSAKASIAVLNEVPAVGGAGAETLDEIRENAIANFNSQNRAVTRKDYEVRTYAMSPEFGSVAKVYVAQDTALDDKVNAVLRDNDAKVQFTNLVKSAEGKTDEEIGKLLDSFILEQQQTNAEFNNPFAINMYLLGYDVNGKLTTLNAAVKQNVKTYLEEYRLLTDAVNMLNGFVINIGINYEIAVYSNYNKKEVLLKVNNALKDYFSIDKWQMNQPINLSEVELEIANIEGVSSVNNLKIVNLKGGNYSRYAYNIDEATRNKIVYPSLDPAIFEVKYPNTDIKGRAL